MEAMEGIKHMCGVAAAGSTAKGIPGGASLAGASELQILINLKCLFKKCH